MSRVIIVLVFFSGFTWFLALPSSDIHAQERGGPEHRPYLSIGGGYYDVLDEDDAIDFRLEYRFAQNLGLGIKPALTADMTSDGAIFAGLGLYRDFFVNDSLYLTPSVGVNVYDEGESGLNLGHDIEFRTQIEAGYERANHHRISLGFSHYSNASLSEENPGTEIVTLYYHFPVSTY